MPLILITVQDSPDGAQVAVVAEPALPADAPNFLMSPAQVAALTMLNALKGEISKDRGLIQLLS